MKEIHFDAELEQPGGGMANYIVMLLPFPLGATRPDGFYLLIAHSSAAPLLHPRAKLMRALQEDEYILFAQSIRAVSLTTLPQLVEVLLRWQEEENYMAPPGGFFPVAERYNLMPEIDRWVIKNLIEWAGAQQRNDPAWRMLVYCVNLAGASLEDPEFAIYVQREVQRQKFPGRNLCFDISEPDVLSKRAAVHAFISAIRPLGCQFGLDNFGSTQKSLEPLKGLGLDYLKIDGAIILKINKRPEELFRVRQIIMVSHSLGIKTIAGFVEDDDTLRKLQEIGIDYVQGFGVSKPAPISG